MRKPVLLFNAGGHAIGNVARADACAEGAWDDAGGPVGSSGRPDRIRSNGQGIGISP